MSPLVLSEAVLVLSEAVLVLSEAVLVLDHPIIPTARLRAPSSASSRQEAIEQEVAE